MPPTLRATMVTTTSYGTWLPGDLRGYVEDGIVLPGNPALLNHTKHILGTTSVFFSDSQQQVLVESIQAACEEFDYALAHLSVESWHLHWIVSHGFDPVEKMVGRLKNRMRQSLNTGRIWTEGYWHRCLFDERDLEIAAEYIARHAGYREIPRS